MIKLTTVNGKKCLERLNSNIKPFCIDFDNPELTRRIIDPSRFRSELYKAVKLKDSNFNVLDATAGLGRDAFFIASFGINVSMIEHNRIVHELLEDGLTRGKDSKVAEIISRMELFYGSAEALIGKLCTTKKFDVIYLDPMFTGMKQSPKPKKELMLLRDLLDKEETNDNSQLLDIALKHAKKKVVIKRHKLSPYLAGKQPNHSIVGKTNRFDIYLIN